MSPTSKSRAGKDKIEKGIDDLETKELTKVIKKEVTPDSDQYLEYLSLFIGLYKLK